MGLWDSSLPGASLPALPEFKALSAEEFKEEWAKHLVTHCEHGNPRTAHCPWCYIQTPAYRQSLADAMWHVLD